MAEEQRQVLDKDGNPVLDENGNPTFEKVEEQEEDLKDSFLKGDDKDMHRISSALGRALKDLGEQKKTNQQLAGVVQNLASKLDEIGTTQQYQPPKNTNPSSLDKLNEQWQERILSGDVMGVVNDINKFNQQAQDNLVKMNRKKVDSIMGSLKEQPLFDDIADKVKESAYTLVSSGYSAEDATSYAYEKARADRQAELLASLETQSPGTLETLRGGKRTPPPKEEGKLPPNAEKACQRDIAEGLFKDRKEWIDNLSPQLRVQYGV